MLSFDRTNALVGLMYMVGGSGFAWAASHYPIGTSARIGPGFFPVGIGLALVAMGIWVMVASFRAGNQGFVEGWKLRPLFAVVAAVIAFAALIEPAGLIVSICALVVIASLAHSPFSWRSIGGLLFVLIPMTLGIFVLLLRLPMSVLPPFFAQ